MSAPKRKPTIPKDELQRPFTGAGGGDDRPILSPAELADLCGVSRKTIYQWISQGRLDGAFRKRGKHVFIWRDRALDLLYNGPDWSNA